MTLDCTFTVKRHFGQCICSTSRLTNSQLRKCSPPRRGPDSWARAARSSCACMPCHLKPKASGLRTKPSPLVAHFGATSRPTPHNDSVTSKISTVIESVQTPCKLQASSCLRLSCCSARSSASSARKTDCAWCTEYSQLFWPTVLPFCLPWPSPVRS